MIHYCQFACKINGSEGELSCSENHIYIKVEKQLVQFKITLNLHVKWKWGYEMKKLEKCQIEDKIISAPQANLEKLKQYLSGRVMYLGIMEQYEEINIIKEKENKKICIVESTINYRQYFCKVWKKKLAKEFQVFQEIKILKLLEFNTNIVKLIEVFESSNNYYLIFEKLTRPLENDYTHEENQVIIKEILYILDFLHYHKVIHGNIRPSNFMFDGNNVLKIVGFTNAYQLPQNIKSEHMDLFSLHKILLYLYNIEENIVDLEQGIYPEIPDHGTNLLKGLISNTQYRFNITQALSHPFINAEEQDHKVATKAMSPKFKLQLPEC